jgi:hypothetical protein
MIEVSCCGFPIKREIYYQNFSVVEIQQTFISKEPKRKEEESPLFLRVDPFCYCKEINEK